jgi:hypothetical protein
VGWRNLVLVAVWVDEDEMKPPGFMHFRIVNPGSKQVRIQLWNLGIVEKANFLNFLFVKFQQISVENSLFTFQIQL